MGAAGCGGGRGISSPTAEKATAKLTDDQRAIYRLISGVPDSSTTLPRLREIFTRDGAPSAADLNKFKTNRFIVEGDINVSGDTATFNVAISPNTENAPPPVIKPWTAKKDPQKGWLISEAQLP
jgi:hypothetical protein